MERTVTITFTDGTIKKYTNILVVDESHNTIRFANNEKGYIVPVKRIEDIEIINETNRMYDENIGDERYLSDYMKKK